MPDIERSQRLSFLAIIGDTFLASAIEYILAHEFDAEPLGYLTQPHHLTRWPRALAPHIVVLDGRGPTASRADVVHSCRVIRERWPAASVVIVADTTHDTVANATRDAIAPPSHHAATVAHLVEAVRGAACTGAPSVLEDGSPSRRSATNAVMHRPTPARRERARLSERECQVVALLSSGCCNKEIARELGITLATVKNHIHHILAKLGVERRGQIAARMRPHEREVSDRGSSDEPNDPLYRRD